jgi:hypothetical protein
VGSLQSRCIHTQFHWSSDPPFASRHEGPRFKPRGVLKWNQDSPVSFVSLHYQLFEGVWNTHNKSIITYYVLATIQ